MNSGCYDNDISKILLSIKVIDLDNLKEKVIKKEDINFLYRGTNLPNNLIITAVKLKGIVRTKEEINTKQTKFIEQKKFHNQAKSKLVEAHLRILAKIKKPGC